ncbi:MAG: hypothetical protein SFU87_08405 [Chitinophagaceae bacterium]|nr:hypothetical protein [Chitinophagaceae bacterium]
MRRFLIIISTIFSSTHCSSQDTTNLKNWKTYQVPTDNDTLTHYNWSNNDWIVFSKGNDIHARLMGQMPFVNELPFKIEPLDEKEKYKMRGKRSVLKVDDGYLVGFWKGEWGGCLFWFNNDGKQRYQVSGDMIVQFLKRNNKYYAIEGLAHLSMSDGSVIEIEKANGKWTTKEYVRLHFAPYAADIDSKNNFIIVTSDNLLSVDTNKKVDTLITEGFWGGLYPTSMVIKRDVAFVGMRHGVFRFYLPTKKQEWLMRD